MRKTCILVFWRCRNKEPHSSGFLCRVVLPGTKSDNLRWLNAVKETKIVLFVRDNSGDKAPLGTIQNMNVSLLFSSFLLLMFFSSYFLLYYTK